MRQEPTNAYLLKRVESLEASMGRLVTQEELDSEVYALQGSVSDVEKGLDSLRGDLDYQADALGGDVDILLGKVKALEGLLAAIEARLDALDDMNLNERLCNLEPY